MLFYLFLISRWPVVKRLRSGKESSILDSDWIRVSTGGEKMPSRYGKENTYQMEPINTGHHENEAQTHYKYDLGYSPDIPHAKQHTRNSKPSHLDIPRTSISYDESKPNYIEPNVSRLRQLKTNTFNFLEGKKTYRSKMWHRFV